MARLILWCYNLLAHILIGPLCLYVRKHPNFQGTLKARLGLKLPPAQTGDVFWFHAASLGEVKAVSGLIEAFKARQPECRIVLTSMTATGRQAASKIKGVDLILSMPFDLAWVMRRYLARLKPQALVVVETEIWPNLLIQAQRAKVKTFFVNARLTQKAARNYRWIRPLTARALSEARVLAMAEADAGRFKALGALHVEVLGNLKFDALRNTDPARAEALRATLGCGGRPVFIAGSIREGEEAYVMEAIIAARQAVPGLFAMIAPRHTPSIAVITKLAEAAGLSCGLRSQSARGGDLLIIDTVGELFDLYGVAAVAFIGGSLVDLGGQNILEPIAWGVPTIHGPHMENFLWAMEIVKGYTMVVDNAAELGRTISAVLSTPDDYAERSLAAKDALIRAQGATGRYVDALLCSSEK